MTIQEAKDQAAKEWNTAFDYRSLRNGVQVGNIAMLHIDRVNDRAIELYASQFKSPDSPLNPSGPKVKKRYACRLDEQGCMEECHGNPELKEKCEFCTVTVIK